MNDKSSIIDIASLCPICKSTNLTAIDTVISDFVMSRITDGFTPGSNYPVKLCFCNDCTFAFYDYRMTDEEISRLYADYRSKEYQQERERYECWYTEKVNDAMNNNAKALQEQKKVIGRIVSENIHREIRSALDYGGNEGKTFTDNIGTQEKYVFDISGAPTVEGVKSISRFEDLKEHSYDFIMCNHVFEHLTEPMKMMQTFREIGNDETVYYIEVPSENPFTGKQGRHSIMRNISLAFNPNFSIIKLAKYYFKLRKSLPMQMNEHINFFTPQSIRTMAELSGFKVMDVQENEEYGALGSFTVLSMLFRMI